MDAATAMTALAAERGRFVRELEQLRGSLMHPGRDSADRLDMGADDAVETLADELDEGIEEELQRSIDEVDQALARIGDGTYGICIDCGRSIPDKRLEALPASARCIECQSKSERR